MAAPQSGREEIHVGETIIRFRVEGEDSGGSVAMFEFEIPAGAHVPAAHSHDAYEETIYGLEGVVTFTVEGARHDLGPGDCLCIRRGAVHRFDNFAPGTAKGLAVVTPGILGPAYFREIAAILKAAVAGPPDIAAIHEVMRRYGLTPVAG
jgi:quercetin dioxygenase-like cupin family protein